MGRQVCVEDAECFAPPIHPTPMSTPPKEDHLVALFW